jgi:dihydroorotate dehydrogenase
MCPDDRHCGNDVIYRLLFKLALSRMDPERAHVVAARASRLVASMPLVGATLRRLLRPTDPALRVRALGVEFPSPLGVAAGFDKEATWFDALSTLGFGFVEVGTVTAEGQPGNPKPRVFRLLKDNAVVNRMGFPNPGADVVARRLAGRRADDIVAVNIGKTRRASGGAVCNDYRVSVQKLARYADFLVVNVSSPNTPGLRDLQTTERLGELMTAVRTELAEAQVRIPVLVKIAPDLADEDIDAIADLAVSLRLDGIIAINTSIERAGLLSDAATVESIGAGGISGRPLKERALEVLQRLRARTGDDLVLVSVGGIETAQDAWDRILAGATLVQAHTGFVYGGPLWPHRVNRGLAKRVREYGRASIQDVVGTGAVRSAVEQPAPLTPAARLAPL